MLIEHQYQHLRQVGAGLRGPRKGYLGDALRAQRERSLVPGLGTDPAAGGGPGQVPCLARF